MPPRPIEDFAPGWITFLRAEDWGMAPQHGLAYETLNDPETFIHHSAGGQISSDHITALKRLEDFSHNRGYATIGYDIVVHSSDPNGPHEHIAIAECRGGRRSAATLDRNEIGEAICLMGYTHPGHSLSRHPSPKEVEALAWAVAWSIQNGWSAETTELLGHRENPAHPGATACPGDYLMVELNDIWEMTESILEQRYDTVRPDPETDPEMFLWTHPDFAPAYLIDGGTAMRVTPLVYETIRHEVVTFVENDEEFLVWCEERSGVPRGGALPRSKSPGVYEPGAGIPLS